MVSAGSARLPRIGSVRANGWIGIPPVRLLLGLAIVFGVSACTAPRVDVVIFGERPLKVTKRPAAPPRPADGAYTVRKGDTVYGIARRYGNSIRGIIDANNLRPPYLLMVGQRLSLPSPRLHTVVAGDTVNEISQHFQVAMNELVRLNDLPPPYTIIVGQKLRLPAGRPATAALSQAQTRTKVGATQKSAIKLSVKTPARTSLGTSSHACFGDVRLADRRPSHFRVRSQGKGAPQRWHQYFGAARSCGEGGRERYCRL